MSARDGLPGVLDTGAVTVPRESVQLRPLVAADSARLHEWTSQERASTYQAWGPDTVAETEEYVFGAADAWKVKPQSRFVWAATVTDLVVGVGELAILSTQWRRADISGMVHTDWWGRGVASEVARLMCAFGFDRLQLERIEGTCDPRNRASASVLGKLGMTHEGTMRRTVKIRTGWRDSELHSLIRPEWGSPLASADLDARVRLRV